MNCKIDELNQVAEKIVNKLCEKGYTITTAESCTGGMISSAIVNIPGASTVLNEAIVTYSNDAKVRYLGVQKEILDKYGAVSEQVAYQMAEGAAKLAKTDCAIAVTGIAGPDGGTEDKPVGTVYAGFYFKGKVSVIKYTFLGDRYQVRYKTTETVLEELFKILNAT